MIVHLRHVAVIATTVVLLWRRELALVLGTTRRRVAGMVICSVVLAVAMGIMLAMVAASQITAEVLPELRAQILRTSFAGAAMTAGVIAVALCVSIPTRTAIQNVLELVPVGRVPTRIGQLAPLHIAGGLYAVCISSTSIVILVRSSPGPVSLLWGMVCYLVLIQVSLALTVSGFTLLQSLVTRAVRLPLQYGTAMAGFAVIALVLATSAPQLLTTAPHAHSWSDYVLPSRILSALAHELDVPRVMMAAGWVALASAAVWLSSRTHRVPAKQRQLRVLHGSLPARLRPSWGYALDGAPCRGSQSAVPDRDDGAAIGRGRRLGAHEARRRATSRP